MEIQKASTARLKSIHALGRKGPRSKTSLFLVEGPKLVREVVEAGWKVETMLVTSKALEYPPLVALLQAASAEGSEILRCNEKDMAYASATEQSQGVLAVVYQKARTPDGMMKGDGRIFLALDGVQDPGNVGTCVRSAEWFGADGVFLGTGCASMYNDKTVRASAGSIFRIPTVEGLDLATILPECRKHGFRIIGADASASHPYFALGEQTRAVVVLGSEGTGFSDDVGSTIEMFVSIPRQGKAESLNVAIAGSVILAHLAHLHGSGEL